MSDAASFTPGPWEMVNDHPNPITAASLASIRPVKRPPDFYAIEIASVYGCTAEPRQRANARLIAAAPDLVAALHEALEFIDDQVDVVDGDYGIPAPNRAMQVAREIREALSKAGVCDDRPAEPTIGPGNPTYEATRAKIVAVREAKLAELSATNAELVKALEPLVAECGRQERVRDYRDGDCLLVDSRLTIGTLRRIARTAALAAAGVKP